MSKWLKIRQLLASNKHLRTFRNDFKDRCRTTKYQINSISGKRINNDLNSKEKEIILTEEEIEEKNNWIINKNLSLINLQSFKDNSPLISIIILNKNGYLHLKRLFKDFKKNIEYPTYEIIIVDNASNDYSISFLENIKNSLPLKIIRNNINKSFSEANNQAAKLAKGEYLLFLNNDVEPTYGWLNQMMQAAIESEDTGAIGAKLIYPDCSNSQFNKHQSFKIQHEGIVFKEESNGFIKPYNLNNNEPFNNTNINLQDKAAVTASTLLIEKDKFWKVGGYDEGYNYGYEDVDLCLKLLKKGYNNIYCPTALLYHYEFGTQETDKKRKIRKRRLRNRELFKKKWNHWLHKQLFKDKLYNERLFSDNPLKVAFVVTESGKDASAGDYFTAYELSEYLKEFGWKITFLLRRGPHDWYNVDSDVDILISLLDVYDPRKIRCTNKSLIKIAWLRNWFERWIINPGLSNYDLILASSEIACNYIENKTGLKTFLLPIATNPNKFNDQILANDKYLSDYCFTGSYWNDPREIMDMLDPENMHYKFMLFGKNWENFVKFKKYYHGFLNYSKLPEVYASTKIVIDDVNRGAKNFGAVNSRVYDAISGGTLVLTNDETSAHEIFNDKLPVYKSKEELNYLIQYYLTNENSRKAKIKELQEIVLEKHTYENRANTLRNILEQQYILKTKIAIKIPAPKWKQAHEWGDYHLAVSLKKEFEKNDCNVTLQVLSEWNSDLDSDCDVIIVLRGLSKYYPKDQHFNIMWNISHPDEVTIEEYNQYDYVFIASEVWTQKIMDSVHLSTPIEALLQCTDPELFYPDYSDEYQHELLFVGNSRKVFRKIIKDLLPTDKDLSVYGKDWKKFLNKRYIKGKQIPYSELRKAYSSCKILLNDHWDDMRDKGFVSNRIFDGFASGAFIISDNVEGSENIFGNTLISYNKSSELKDLIDNYLDKEEERIKKSKVGRNIVVKHHTFNKRVNKILEVIKSDSFRK